MIRTFVTDTDTQLVGSFTFEDDGTCTFEDGRNILIGRMVFAGARIRFELNTYNGEPVTGTVFVGRFLP